MRTTAPHNLGQTQRIVTICRHVRWNPGASRALWEACRQQAAAKNRATEELLARPRTPLRRNNAQGVRGLQGQWQQWREDEPGLQRIPQKVWRPGVALAKTQIDAWEKSNGEQLEALFTAEKKDGGDRSARRRVCAETLFRSRKLHDRTRRNVLVIHDGVRLVDGKTIRIHGIADLQMREALPDDITIRSVTLVERTPRARGRNVRPEDRTWDMRITVRVAAPLKPLAELPATAGIDHGIVHAETVALSNGTSEHLHYDTPEPTRQRRYKKLQQRKERCRKRRRGRRASRRRRALQRQQNHMRARALHQRSEQRRRWANQLARRCDLVSIELLDSRNMRGSARGSNEQPGRNVRAKSGLNRKLAESSPGLQTNEQIAACIRHGTRYRLVPAGGTSITCARCGHKNPKNRKNQAVFRCRACPHQANADVNAAEVIRLLAEAYTKVGVSRPWATAAVAERAEVARRKAQRAKGVTASRRSRKPERAPPLEAAAR